MKRHINESWIELKEFCGENLEGFDTIILDFIAVYDILLLHARGISAKRIAKTLDYEYDYVVEAIQDFLLAKPHKHTLEISPLFIFSCVPDFDDFSNEIECLTDIMDIKELYDSISRFREIEWRIDDYYK